MLDEVSRFRKAIKDSGLSYMELEKRTDISHSSLQRFAVGKTDKLPVGSLNKLATATGTSIRWLLNLEKQISNPNLSKFEKLITYSYNSEQGTAEQGFNSEQLNDINKLMKAAKELSPEKLAALIQVAENMK